MNDLIVAFLVKIKLCQVVGEGVGAERIGQVLLVVIDKMFDPAVLSEAEAGDDRVAEVPGRQLVVFYQQSVFQQAGDEVEVLPQKLLVALIGFAEAVVDGRGVELVHSFLPRKQVLVLIQQLHQGVVVALVLGGSIQAVDIVKNGNRGVA